MKLLMPREHGAWAMLAVPFIIGGAVYGFNWWHIPLFLGWFSLYLCSYPLMMTVRQPKNNVHYLKWLVIYALAAGAWLTGPLLRYPGILWLVPLILPLLLINVYYARRRQERALFNDFCAVAELSLGGVASSYIGAGGVWTEKSWLVYLICILFFMGSVFFVKTMIREKNNRQFRYLSWSYHVLLTVLPLLLTGGLPLTLAFLPSMGRAICYGGRDLTPLRIGQIEIVNSLWFTIWIVAWLISIG
ncbi:hypothetical protein Desca_0986 [Desulfotomaculum nigrificans CO-1-SRB]|uniref:YwiC-like protein n=1 Tax=Desulfotomaculum nigrificans (strain DSM 14880 / VKM B-2319 / CO-1-SRB) TaxID=868595 RepID=F6B2N1_DESCC|nr:YwiC-like family protein [Desulfotomaculum nigrificans]AEF93860.1 hypothetical protein Desca_0986 [Desulfotomaculum nigrificans CO-1-SRB]